MPFVVSSFLYKIQIFRNIWHRSFLTIETLAVQSADNMVFMIRLHPFLYIYWLTLFLKVITEEKIRKQLIDLLSKDPSQLFQKFAELSNQLTSFDTENARFSVDAGIVDRLGKKSLLLGKKLLFPNWFKKFILMLMRKKVDIYFKDSDEEGGNSYNRGWWCRYE